MNPVTFNLLQIAPLAIAVSISVGLVQLIKYADEGNKLIRFYPLISFVTGLLVSLVVFHIDFATAIVTGLSAGGAYEVAKTTVMNVYGATHSETPTSPSLPVPPPMGQTADYVNPSEGNDTPAETPTK